MSASTYLRYQPAELERQYSPSSCIPDITVYLRHYREASEQAQRRLQAYGHTDIAYGPKTGEKLDLFLPEQSGCPLLVFIHGGYWQDLGKQDSAFAAETWLARGWGWCAVNYTLAPGASLTEIVAEMRRLWTWLQSSAAEYGYDPQRLLWVGHSAGAHLAAMLLATVWPTPQLAPWAAVLLSGIYDLAPIRATYVNTALQLRDAEVAELSPLILSPQWSCPVLVAWGENETDEFKRQSREFAATWRQKGSLCHEMELAGKNHFDAVLDLGFAESELFAAMAALPGVRL